MKVFHTRESFEAIAHSLEDGIALHLHRIIPDRGTAPRCFVDAVDRGQPIAHVFCLDIARLKALARTVGVRVVHIDREGTDRQHLDLCSGPLWKACKMIDADQKDKLAEVLAALKERTLSS